MGRSRYGESDFDRRLRIARRMEMQQAIAAKAKRKAELEKAKPWKRLSPRQLRFMPYEEFLQTAFWQRLRRKVMKRDHGLCRMCGAPAVHVHHLTYKRHGREHPDDLVALCGTCHGIEHGKIEAPWAVPLSERFPV